MLQTVIDHDQRAAEYRLSAAQNPLVSRWFAGLESDYASMRAASDEAFMIDRIFIRAIDLHSIRDI